jgi:ribonuclease HI
MRKKCPTGNGRAFFVSLCLLRLDNAFSVTIERRLPQEMHAKLTELILFTDGSVNTRLHIGYGAYLAVPGPGRLSDELIAHVKVKLFTQTSSTKLELQTLLWALSEIPVSVCKLLIYTDSQNIIGLPARRERLEQRDYRSNKHVRLGNSELYREFYRLTDQRDYELVKVNGHRPARQKDDIDRLFSLVDQASRNALREATRG